MDAKTIDAILAAVRRGLTVEISSGKDGTLKIKTVTKKNLILYPRRK